MLFAKINPPAITVRQTSPFDEPTQILGELMKVTAERYELGSNKVRFQVAFGYLIQPGEMGNTNNKPSFQVIHFDGITLEGADIESWGQDDTVIIDIIATKMNTSVVSYENIDIND